MRLGMVVILGGLAVVAGPSLLHHSQQARSSRLYSLNGVPPQTPSPDPFADAPHTPPPLVPPDDDSPSLPPELIDPIPDPPEPGRHHELPPRPEEGNHLPPLPPEMSHPLPRPPSMRSAKEEIGRWVIASAIIDGSNRCKVGGLLDGVALIFMVDTGAPLPVEISADLLPKLNRRQSQYNFAERWPGTKYGPTAQTSFDELRIGGFVLVRPEVRIYERWSQSFGNEIAPLLGMGALKTQGENEGDTCRPTMPETRSAAR
jgi:hypothetical protein